jgi:hypothetical protein
MTRKSTVARNTTPAIPMTAEQRATSDRDGYLIIRGALRPDEAADARDAIDRVYAAMAKAGSLGPPSRVRVGAQRTLLPDKPDSPHHGPVRPPRQMPVAVRTRLTPASAPGPRHRGCG